MKWLETWKAARLAMRVDDYAEATVCMREVLADPELPECLVPYAKDQWLEFMEKARVQPIQRLWNWWNERKPRKATT